MADKSFDVGALLQLQALLSPRLAFPLLPSRFPDSLASGPANPAGSDLGAVSLRLLVTLGPQPIEAAIALTHARVCSTGNVEDAPRRVCFLLAAAS